MEHFNQFLDDLRTIDYGLLCVDLYDLAEVPVIIDSPPSVNKAKWTSGHKPGSIEDFNASIIALKEIADIPANGVQCSKLTHEEDVVKTVTSDWDEAVWVRYSSTQIGINHIASVFENQWMEKKPGSSQIHSPLMDVLSLAPDKVQTYLRLLSNVASKLTDSATVFWDEIGRLPKFKGEPLWWSLRHFERFHRHISLDFNTINYPPFTKENKLYFGREFLDRYELIVYKKVELIVFFMSEVKSSMPIKYMMPYQYEETSNDYWLEKENTFNGMKSLAKVESWFIQLAQTINSDGEPFLTVDEVRLFIRKAFVGEASLSKLTLNMGGRSKANVIGLFHLYYSYCNTHHSKIGKIDKQATAKKYIKLLTDNFDNWTFDQIDQNFRSGGDWVKPIES